MTSAAWLTLLLGAGALAPGAALGQEPAQLALGRPQPHFVAAWAPKKEREAERSAVLAQRVSLELTDVSLDAALKALTNQAGLRITYSPAVLPAGKRVTISASDVAVVTALTEMLFRSGLDVVVDRDGALALVVCRHQAREAEVQDSGRIVGRITDKETTTAISGATVAVEGTQLSVVTDTDGSYRLPAIAEGTYSVRARFIGYAPQVLRVSVAAREEVTANFSLERSIQQLDQVVVTGTIVPTAVKALPTPVTVIDAETIAAQRPNTVADLFRQAVPGSVSWNIPTTPSQTSLSVRGASTLTAGSGQMKVFVDGIESALPMFAAIDPNSIERVEVIRGPQAAAIYGSDAIGGVVQIFTRRGDSRLTRPEVSAEASLGIIQTPYPDFDRVPRQEYRASLRGGTSEVSYSLGAGYSKTGNYLPNGEISEQSNPSVYGGMRFTRGILDIDVSGRYYTQNTPAVFNPELLQTGFVYYSKPNYQPARLQNQTLGARLTIAPVPWWKNTITVGLDRFNQDLEQTQPRRTTPDDTLLTILNENRAKASIGYLSSLQGSLGPSLDGSITVGFDHWSFPTDLFFTGGAVSTSGTIVTAPGQGVTAIRDVTNNTGYLAQAQLGVRDMLFLTAGVRAEQNTNFGDDLGTPVSPRVGLSYVRQVGGATLKFRGSWGRAIRAPAPGLKLGAVSAGSVTLPNLALGPERQQGWDLGVDATFGSRATISATYYDQVADGLIQQVILPGDSVLTFQSQNVGRVGNDGVEIEGKLSLGRVRLQAQYGYARSEVERLAVTYTGDLRVGEQSQLTPKHTAGASVSSSLGGGTTVAAGLTYVGSWTYYDVVAYFRCLGQTGPCRNDTFALDRDYLVEFPGFAKINASVVQRITPLVSGFLAIDNLTDNDAQEYINFNPVIGRITTVGLSFRY